MKTCNDCPFILGSKNTGTPEWLTDVFNLVRTKSLSHSCHKTDAKADGYIGGKKRDCDGFKMLNINNQTGFHIHKNTFKNFVDFFKSYVEKYKIEGLIK